MKNIRSKRINGFLATENNALWLDNKTVVNSVELFVKYLDRFERNLLSYEGRGKYSFYFRFRTWARFRIADHPIMTGRSKSEISIIRTPFQEFEKVKYDWYDYQSIKIAKNNFEFYFNLLLNLKNSFENSEEFKILKTIYKRINSIFKKNTWEILFVYEYFYELFFNLKQNNFYFNKKLFNSFKDYFLIKDWKVIWFEIFNKKILFPQKLFEIKDYFLGFKSLI